MSRSFLTGQLYLNGRRVGEVAIRGWHGAWGLGEFAPEPAFEEFAPLFDEWARLMRADASRLSRPNAARLREVEFRLYAVHARLWIGSMRQWRVIDILNIDGRLIEWKEGWSECHEMGETNHAEGDSHARRSTLGTRSAASSRSHLPEMPALPAPGSPRR